MPGGGSFVSMGVTVISSRLRTNRSVIMTFEGFVVFDGEYDGRLIVHRALPPFDSPHFAEGLMEDIRLIFFEPQGPVIGAGDARERIGRVPARNSGRRLHRHRRRANGTWELHRYSPDRTPDPDRQGPAAGRARCRYPGNDRADGARWPGYKLVMTLVEAVPVRKEGG